MTKPEKLALTTCNIVDSNVSKIAKLFPSCITEVVTDGRSHIAVDFDLLRQELSHNVVDGATERYSFTWPNKRKAVLLANAPTTKTLRPVRNKSINFDTTKNIYIEGDNLETLKCLRETYLGKVKVIYIDPPYNTGKDFLYKDDFKGNTTSYLEQSEQIDEAGNRLVTNLETNGRFHTDWLNMIYPRLKIARDLLSNDGAIFISIGDEEYSNLKKICDEIFGESNYINTFIVKRYDKNLNKQFIESGIKSYNVGFEYILAYKKSNFFLLPTYRALTEERAAKGYWKGFWNEPDRPTMRYEILGFTPTEGQWKWKQETALEAVKNYKEYEENFASKMTLEEYWRATGCSKKFIRRNLSGKGKNQGVENWIEPSDKVLRTTNWLDFLASKADSSTRGLFDYPKNVDLIVEILKASTSKSDLVLDFFSGSATTAHAVMKLNAEDGGNRKFIMVQIPELCKSDSAAFQAGFHNICELGMERIRRCGELIGKDFRNLDVGVRLFKLDSSNMNPVFAEPAHLSQGDLFKQSDNIKANRSSEDLLVQVMLSLGVTLDSPIERTIISNKEVFNVANGFLLACFDQHVTNDVVETIAKEHPVYAVFRDSSFSSDYVADNFEQIFKTYAPESLCKVI